MLHLNPILDYYPKNIFMKYFLFECYQASSIFDFNENKDNVLTVSKNNLLFSKEFRGSILVTFLESILYIENERFSITDQTGRLEINFTPQIRNDFDLNKLTSGRKKKITLGYNKYNENSNLWLHRVIEKESNQTEKQSLFEVCFGL